MSGVLNITTHNIAAVTINFNPYTQICGLTYWRAANNPSLMSTVRTVSICVLSDAFRQYKEQMISPIPPKKSYWCFTGLHFFLFLTQQSSLGYNYKHHTFAALKIWLPSASRCFDSVLEGILIAVFALLNISFSHIIVIPLSQCNAGCYCLCLLKD